MPANADREAKDTADLALREWSALAAGLAPIIGQRGLRALYGRSLHLTRSAFPCLAGHDPENSDGMELLLSSLRQNLEAVPAVVAREAHEALLRNFTGLLESLIGAALTAQLIQNRPESGLVPPPQESDNDR